MDWHKKNSRKENSASSDHVNVCLDTLTHVHTFVQTHTLPIWLAAQMVALGDARGQKDSSNQLHTTTHAHNLSHTHTYIYARGRCDAHLIVYTYMHKCSAQRNMYMQANPLKRFPFLIFCLFSTGYANLNVLMFHLAAQWVDHCLSKLNFHFKWHIFCKNSMWLQSYEKFTNYILLNLSSICSCGLALLKTCFHSQCVQRAAF